MTLVGWQQVVLPLLTGFVLALAFVPVCRIIATRTGLVAHPRNDRWHRQIVPMLGGCAMAVALLVGTLSSGAAAQVIVPLSCAMAIFILGLVDDVLALKPATKLIVEIALAATLVYFDYRLYWLDSRLFDSLLTMMWIVGLTNAFNLLDNMDGLCAGTAFVVAVINIAGLLTGVMRESAGPEIAFLSVLAGSIAGFLVYNFPPASIFMGDCGSLLLGFSLATFTLNHEGVRGSRSDILSVIAGPVFVLLIPIFDTTLVTVARLLSGRSPAVGGRDHSSHRLVAIGLSERNAVFVLWLLAAIGGAIGLTLRSATPGGWSMAVGALFLVAMCVFAVYLARVRVYDDTAVTPGLAQMITPLVGDFMHKRRAFEVMIDFGLIFAAYYEANRLRLGPYVYLDNVGNFYNSLPLVVATQLVVFFIVGVYRGASRPFEWRDSKTIAKGILFGAATAQLAILYIYLYFSYSRSVFVIYAALLFASMIASRVLIRAVARMLP